MRTGEAGRRGFALVAAAIWLACVAVLAGVALPHPEGAERISRDEEYARCIREYSVAISRFVWLNKRNPADLAELSAAVPPVLREIRRDPATGGTGSWILSTGPDGRAHVATASDARSADGTPYADWRIDPNGALVKAPPAAGAEERSQRSGSRATRGSFGGHP